MENFMDALPEAEKGYIISQVDQVFEITENIYMVPYQYLLI